MSDRFDPFAGLIDPDRALAILRDATAGAEDGELFLERARGESLVFDDGRLRSAGYNASQGFGLRAVRGGVGQAHVVDGRQAHSVLVEVFTERGVGTMVLPDDLRTGQLPVVTPYGGHR